ncbi:peptidase aspartic [Penicillium brasilianum]|uniref:Peptidase aspartic n=1 Tax=Penicillium brasilianum TaxID=104259 RepID=A0A1S9S0D4_PENBI|nr:peptidase aspartic [Penicillium brasilianum]
MSWQFELSALDPVSLAGFPPDIYDEGNDGPWSSFYLRVGTPEQSVRVLVSTASPESMVVLSDYGCSTSVFSNAPSDCAVSRGTLFNASQSSSWQDLGLFGINQDGVGLEANLGYYQRADFALDTLSIGLTGPTLKNQTVAGIATPEPFYLGIFGLNPQPVNFTSLGNFSSPSFLTTLKGEGTIPSLSWSYTAGAKYRLKQVYGQLIFSGYDNSRFVDNSMSFTMAGDITRDLVVYLQSISYSGSTSATLLSEPIAIFIDSTDPNLWLPGSVCDEFEKAFGLTLDGDSGLYLINDTHNTELLDSNAQVAFRLSDVASGGEAVTVTLPYNAFALTAKAPLVNHSSFYFPLKRAANSTQYTLGRVFLQEAYLSVDYERSTFNVSACAWHENAQQDIVTITSKDSATSSCSGGNCQSGNNDSGGSSMLSHGAVAGIAIAALVGVGILAAVLFFFIRRQRQKTAYKATPPETDVSVLSGPVHNAPPSDPSDSSAPQPPFWSPDAIFGGVSESQNGQSSGSTRTHDQSVDERGMELDGHGTQIKPVYHELPDSQVENTRPEPEIQRSNTVYA